jgi:beta-lactam-binding protein with PASTA domain
MGLLLIGAGVVVVCLVIWGITGIVHAVQGPKTVPSVVDMSLSAAKSQLGAAGLKADYDETRAR